MTPTTPRLIDLHTDWILQYAPETTLFDPKMAEHARRALPQAEGYLGATSAAILAVYRDPEDWAKRPDPWRSLGDLITRIEAEFSGRLLIGPEDMVRWHDDPQGLAWGVIGVEGFDALIRHEADLDRLPGLFDRGVRVYQPVSGAESLLGGSSDPGDDRGLTDLGLAFLNALSWLPTNGPRPILDLAHLNPATTSDVLDWFEREASRTKRVIPVYSHGAVAHEGFNGPRALTIEHRKRLRALGGVIGFGVSPPFYQTEESLRRGIEETAEIPFEGRKGYEGIAIGTDFLGVEETMPGLGNAPEVVAWIMRTFEPDAAIALVRENGSKLLEYCVGALSIDSGIAR